MIPFASLADKNMADKIALEIQSQGMEVSVQQDLENSQFVLLISNEEDIPKAQDVYRVMLGLPRQFTQEKEWSEIQQVSMGPVTKYVIVFCVIIFILGYYKIVPELYPVMMLTPTYFSNFKFSEFWKLVTPAFVHFGLIHILFNMMWMKDLGKIVEVERGGNFLILFIIIVSAISNSAQFFSTGANFGGMSGVVYGLLGYLWMYKKFNKNARFSLPKNDVMIMVGWFFLCLSGILVFSIANMAHALGLTIGMLVGIALGVRESSDVKSNLSILNYCIFSLSLPIITQIVEVIKISLKSNT
jgi:GlpG protein